MIDGQKKVYINQFFRTFLSQYAFSIFAVVVIVGGLFTVFSIDKGDDAVIGHALRGN